MNNIELKIIKLLKENGITNKLEISMFLAQMSHESGEFVKLSESLNYSPAGLMATWPKRFTKQIAEKLGRTKEHPANQVAIANLVYGSRMGNEKNGTQDNDGYEYRGGGYMQLTGYDNYAAFLKWLQSKGMAGNLTIDTVDDFVRTPDGAIISALFFWITNKCGAPALRDDIVGVTKIINGGVIGLDDRKAKLAKYKAALGC